MASVLLFFATAAPMGGQASGYGGARVTLTRASGRTALLGGGPLIAFTFGRTTTGVMLSPSEGDADGLQLVPVGPFLEYDLSPDRSLHIVPGVQLVTGAAIYDADGQRWRAALIGIEPRLTVTTGGSATRVGLSAGWRLARATSELGPPGTDLSGFVVGLELRDGVLDPASSRSRQRRGFLSSLFSTRVSRFAGETVHLDGGGTRLVFDRWTVGLGGYVTRSWLRDRELAVAGGWGGVVVEYRPYAGRIGTSWVGLLLGGGGLGQRIEGTDEYETAGMFVLEPTAGIALTPLPFLRIGAVAGYRAARCGECIPGTDSGDVSGVSAGIDLRFGHWRRR